MFHKEKKPSTQTITPKSIPTYIEKAARAEVLNLVGEYLSPKEANRMRYTGHFFYNNALFYSALHSPEEKYLTALLTEIEKLTELEDRHNVNKNSRIFSLVLCALFFAVTDQQETTSTVQFVCYLLTITMPMAIFSVFHLYKTIREYHYFHTTNDLKQQHLSQLAHIKKLNIHIGYPNSPIKELQKLHTITPKSQIKELSFHFNLLNIPPFITTQSERTEYQKQQRNRQHYAQALCCTVKKSNQLASLSLVRSDDLLTKTQLTDLFTKSIGDPTADLRYLQKLTIQFCDTIDDDIFDTLSSLYLLDECSISRCEQITGRGLDQILPQLKKLKLQCYKEEQFNSSVQKANTIKLKYLTLVYCVPDKTSLQKLALCLESLSIRRGVGKDYEPSMIFESHFDLSALEQIKKVNFEFCNFPETLSLPKNLNSLTWKSCPYQHIDLDKWPQTIVQLKTLRLLTVLNLSYAVMETGTLQLIVHNMPNLHTLTVDQMTVEDIVSSKPKGDEAISALAGLKKLRNLSIRWWALTDIGLLALTKSHPHLERLDLSHCTDLTQKAVNRCISDLRNLCFLDYPAMDDDQRQTNRVLYKKDLIKRNHLIQAFNDFKRKSLASNKPSDQLIDSHETPVSKNGFFSQKEKDKPSTGLSKSP